MKRWMTYGSLLGVFVVLMLVVVPAVTAVDLAGHSILFSDARWDVPCETGQGTVSYHLTTSVPAGYTVIHRWKAGDDPIWGPSEGMQEFSEPDGWYISRRFYWLIGTPGWQEETWDVYAPSGILVGTARFFASCATGEIVLQDANIYGPRVPDPSERVQAQVLVDVPVFREPNPDTPIPDTMLKAGQEWFVVGEATGTDGNVWYEVFVGGWHNGWVPGAALFLPGPIPE
jgi:hypothetical protein